MNVVSEVNALSFWQKHSVYAHYLAVMLKLKYFDSIDINILNFDDFINENNIEVRDMGDNWQQNGFARRTWTEYHGIYNWWWKFKPCKHLLLNGL